MVVSGCANVPPNAASRVVTTHDYASAVGVSISGGQENGNNYLLDGGDNTDSHSTKIGACNTVVRAQDGKLYGFNTDAAGIVRPLERRLNTLEGARILVIGAGGAGLGAPTPPQFLDDQLPKVRRHPGPLARSASSGPWRRSRRLERSSDPREIPRSPRCMPPMRRSGAFRGMTRR